MANWPIPRIDAWDTLLKARAIENMSYCIGVNRIGEDENGYKYNGHTTPSPLTNHIMALKRPYKLDSSYGCRSQIWPEFENWQGILSPCFTTSIMKYWCFRLLGSFFPTSILKHFPSPRLMFCNRYNGILLFSRSSAHGKHNFGVHINKNTIKNNKNYSGEAKTPGKLSKTQPPKNT